MKKVKELVVVDYVYDTEKEQKQHMEWMRSQGWDVSSRMKEIKSLYSDEYYLVGKFSKYLPV